MKTNDTAIQAILANILHEAAEISTPEASDGSLALRRLREAGVTILPPLTDAELDEMGLVTGDAITAIEDAGLRSWGEVMAEASVHPLRDPVALDTGRAA